MKIQIQEVTALLKRVLEKHGVSQEEADILSEDYLLGEMQGKASHGLMAFPSLVEKLPIEKQDPEVIRETDAYLFVDAHSGFGTVVGRQFTDQAIEKAKEQGVGVVLIRNMISWLRPALMAEYISNKGMVGFVVNSGGNPMIAPPGGYEPRVGTNPIGIGVPMQDQNLLVDMATSKRAWGEVRKAKFNNTDLPKDTYLNNEGEFAVHPEDAFSVIASGDYKGFSLALFIEILTGSLIGMPMNQQGAKNVDYRTLPRGAMILVINPEHSADLDQFKTKNTRLANDIRFSKRRKGAEEIVIPGDRAVKKENIARNEGLEISDHLWKVLNDLDK